MNLIFHSIISYVANKQEHLSPFYLVVWFSFNKTKKYAVKTESKQEEEETNAEEPRQVSEHEIQTIRIGSKAYEPAIARLVNQIAFRWRGTSLALLVCECLHYVPKFEPGSKFPEIDLLGVDERWIDHPGIIATVMDLAGRYEDEEEDRLLDEDEENPYTHPVERIYLYGRRTDKEKRMRKQYLLLRERYYSALTNWVEILSASSEIASRQQDTSAFAVCTKLTYALDEFLHRWKARLPTPLGSEPPGFEFCQSDKQNGTQQRSLRVWREKATGPRVQVSYWQTSFSRDKRPELTDLRDIARLVGWAITEKLRELFRARTKRQVLTILVFFSKFHWQIVFP